MSPASSTPNRKPGAQPGNSNTFRHGLYSKYLTEAQMESLDEDFHGELMLEIAFARLNLTRLVSRYKKLNKKISPHIT